jgi:hypothetical protein
MTASAERFEPADPVPGPSARSGASRWQGLLTESEPGQHIAQLYTERDFLARSVARFVSEGLRRGDGVVVIATPLHWRAAARELYRASVPIDDAESTGRLVVRDAEQILSTFMRDGLPDRRRFREAIGGLLAPVRATGAARVRAFGEMVDILRHGNLAATWRLEQLWNEVLGEHGIALLCGYSLDVFDARNYRGLVQDVGVLHSHLIPVDDYARFDRAVAQAYQEVFGGGADADDLRQTFVEHYERPAAMPDAEAAVLALRDLVPGTVDAVLRSARRHYASGT